MSPQLRSPTKNVARVAAGQHGVVTRHQLIGAGLSDDQVKRWLAKGLLHRIHRGVYRLGHRAPSMEADYLAAVLACAHDAFLAGRAAASVYRIIKGGAIPRPEVLSLGDRALPGVTTHRARRLDRLDTSRYRRIPITTVPRTLADLAGCLSLDDLAEACHHAEVLHHTRAKHVGAVLARRPNTPGAANLRLVFVGDAMILLSHLEREFVALLRREGLPLPRTNRPASAHYVDCRWPGHRLTVELDSYRFHHSRHAWEQDRRRAREAYARGDEFRRYTYGDVVERPATVLVELRPLLR
jgi:hypothetical protein